MARARRGRASRKRGSSGLVGLMLLAGLAVLMVLLSEKGNPELYPPKKTAAKIDVYVVDHGYHAGLIVPVDRLRQFGFQDNREGAIATSQRFIGHRWLEIGWGYEPFYRQVPTLEKLDWTLAFAAVTNTTSRTSVLHLVGIDQAPGEAFSSSRVLHLVLSEPGFGRLVKAYNEAVFIGDKREPQELGPGLYGDSAFYRANGVFNGLNDCNQWVARLLSASGVPVSQAYSSTSLGLMTELRWRAGGE